MTVPNIVVLRIGERLIHGQGQLWIKALGTNTVVVANDSVSEDTMQQTLMKTVVPKTITICFFSIQHTCDVITKTSPKQTVFIVCRMPEDVLKLVASDVPVKEINVGNIHHVLEKGEMSKYTALSDEDETALRQLRDTYGVASNTRTAVSGGDGAAKVDSNKYL